MKASTGVSGARATQSLRQEGGGGLGQIVPTHLIILALACVLWWIARDMVSTNRTLTAVTQVEFKLSEDLAGKWRIMTQQMRVSLDVAGPMREINDFEGEMLKNSGRFSYQYNITPDDLQNLKPDGRYQVALLVDPDKLQLAGGARPPAELNIRLIVGEHTAAGQDQRIRVVLEQIVTRPVRVGVAGITGIIPGYKYSAEVQDIESLRAVGPASEVERIMQDGKALIHVAGTLIDDILRNRAQVDGTDREKLLLQGSIVSTLPFVPPPGSDVRVAGPSGVVGDVRVKITFERQENVPKNGEFDVNLTYPGWLTTKRNVKVSGWQPKIPVLIDVSDDTQSAWPDAVKAVLDLSHIKEDDKAIEKVENSPRRILKLAGMYVSLQIDAERLKAFKKPGVTDWRQYLPINEITIEWEEP